MTIDRPVTLAAIIGAHGVGGEVRLKLFGQSFAGVRAHASFNDGALTLLALREVPGGAIARFAEITDRAAAEALRGTELTIPRTTLPTLDDGEYYHADLIGLTCLTGDGEDAGLVVAVENFGAGDIIEIQRPDKKRFMIPMHAVLEISDRIVIDAAYIVL